MPPPGWVLLGHPETSEFLLPTFTSVCAFSIYQVSIANPALEVVSLRLRAFPGRVCEQQGAQPASPLHRRCPLGTKAQTSDSRPRALKNGKILAHLLDAVFSHTFQHLMALHPGFFFPAEHPGPMSA